MHAQVESLARPTAASLTHVILVLCASGHFGVREAIAAATRQEPRRLDSAPADIAFSLACCSEQLFHHLLRLSLQRMTFPRNGRGGRNYVQRAKSLGKEKQDKRQPR